MAITPIKLGSAPNDGQGDNLRTAGQKINDNFAAVEAALATIPTGIEGAGARSFANVDALLANTQVTYGSGANQVVAGNIIRTLAEGFAYRVAASSASDHHVTTAGGLKLYVLPGDNGFNVRAFGAKGDNITDDTAAFNAAVRANGPWGGTRNLLSQGRATILVPRGRYLINGTVQTGGNAAGIVIKGEGSRTTLIRRTNNEGSLFKFQTYSFVEISDMAIVHDTSSPRSAWNNKCFELNGTSGGQKFHISRLFTHGFDRVISHEHFHNEDTSYVSECRFEDCKTWLHARNTQAVINKIVGCTWRGVIDRVFDVVGYGQTHIDTANVVISGAFLHFAAGQGGPSNQFILTNVKFEYAYWGTVRIIEMADSAISANHVEMIGCGITPGQYSPNPDIFQFDLQGGLYTINVIGGDFMHAKIRTRGRAGYNTLNRAFWVKFTGLARSPNMDIVRVGGADSQHPPIIFEDCRDRANIIINTPYDGSFRATPGLAKANINTITDQSGVVRSGTQTYHIPTYGQMVMVKSVKLLIGAKTAGTLGATMRVFGNSAKTQQIGGNVTIGNTAPAGYEVNIPVGAFTSDGVYVEIQRTGAANAHGRIIVETASV